MCSSAQVPRKVVGSVGSWQDETGRMLAYWIGRRYWGRGIATEAVAVFLDLETTRPLHATVAEHNVGSRRVLEKSGFRLVGRHAADDVVELLFELP